jgi:hypothetical protein
MSRIHVAIINSADQYTDEALADLVPALQWQIDHDFRSTWGIAAQLVAVPKGETPDPAMWWLALLNDSDQAGALGYHDLTPDLLPTGKVFINEDLKYGAQVPVTASHELLEMLGDPWINTTAFDPATGWLHAYEAADAVEADEFSYEAPNGVRVSDFVLPQYFDPNHVGKDLPVTMRGNLTEPFSLAPGGYQSYLDLANLDKGWQQEMRQEAEGRVEGRRAPGFPPGSRRQRRVNRWRNDLKVSTVGA